MLREAIDSCLGQTHAGLEVLVVADGLPDEGTALLEEIAGERVRVVRRETRLGDAGLLSTILREARGELIARLDHDAVALPDRIDARSPCSTAIRRREWCTATPSPSTPRAVPSAHGVGRPPARVLIDLLVRGHNPIVGPTAMVHRRVLEVGAEATPRAATSTCWLRAARRFRFRHVPGGPLVR